MTILALEFSSPQRSVAVWRGGGRAVAEVVETGGRATNAFGMIERALAAAGIEREAIGVMAVGLGPGSYTGARAAIAVAQGWQLASGEGGMKLLGVGSVEAIAAEARAEKIFGRVSAVVDAQRNEFYLASYEITAAGWREIVPLAIVPRAVVQARADGGEILAGPEVTRWFPAGKILFPRAARVAELAAGRGDFTPGERLAPVYLRETAFVKTTRRG
jgi:tRNA threonylcarbamoyl adenosine modification protein YeaZ